MNSKVTPFIYKVVLDSYMSEEEPIIFKNILDYFIILRDNSN